jgi:hypothetical protein
MKKLLALAAFSAAAATPAWAEMSYARAQTLGFGYDLIDLDNMDGITPTISFHYDGDAWQSVRIQDPRRAEVNNTRPGYGTLDYDDYATAVELSSAPDRVDAIAVSTFASVLATGRSSTTMTFSLTPWTAVVFHVPYSLDSSVSELGSMATASLTFSGQLSGAGTGSFSAQEDQRWNGTKYGSLTGELATRDDGAFGLVTLQTDAVAGVVPEPRTYAMLLAGLGMLTAWHRRRNPS